MGKLAHILILAVLLAACGDASGGNSRNQTPESVDTTCRSWCANETEGSSCHQGTFESVQPCYEQCLSDYEGAQDCGDEWIAIKDCQLDLACDDLFGDCDSAESAFNECAQIAQARAQADSFCATRCPDQARDECIAQYQSTGTCMFPSTGTVCDQFCAWPDECFVQLGVPAPTGDCLQSCEAQAELVGVDCIAAIANTIACLGTCDLESITQEQALACQDEAQAISNFCD